MKKTIIRQGFYRDSVSLMQVSKEVSESCISALIAMATELNCDLAIQMGFELPKVSPNDLLICLETQSEGNIEDLLEQIDQIFSRKDMEAKKSKSDTGAEPTQSIGKSFDTSLALISVPGNYAFVEAMSALHAGKNVMIFSDNVPIEEEKILKDFAQRNRLIVMGPDCGTSIIGGYGLGFANKVNRGRVGIIAASGTGAQQVSTLLDRSGIGISHCFGLGGRDLSKQIQGSSALTAFDFLESDQETEIIVLISKPVDPSVLPLIQNKIASSKKSVIEILLGSSDSNITDALHPLIKRAAITLPKPKRYSKKLKGLFAGGTLCDESMLMSRSAIVGDMSSNVPIIGVEKIDPFESYENHTFIDFGDDGMTLGRAHPMIDGSIRTELVLREISAPNTGVVIMDIILGFGAQLDPLESLRSPLKLAQERGVPIAISLIGTDADPQGYAKIENELKNFGVNVFDSNAQATVWAIGCLT